MEDDSKTSAPPTATSDPHEGPGKGKQFFDRARSVASTGNFDYAIDMYIEGLNREPFNLDEHKALREVAMRRKIGGAKSSGGFLGAFGGGPKPKYKGKTPKEALLNNTFILARDVGNLSAMLAILRNADILGYKDLVVWIAQMLRDANRTSKPKVEIYIEIAEILAKNKEFRRAGDVVAEAVKIKADDPQLSTLMNDYAAQAALLEGNYDKAESFRDSIKDVSGTRKLIEDENLVKSQEYLRDALVQAKADYEAKPLELQVINKYLKALQAMDQEEHENLAMEIARKAFEVTKIGRLKEEIGTIRMKQFRRNLRMLRDAVKADPNDKEMLRQFQELNKERLAFELVEFHERAERNPTDLIVKFDLGVRLWEIKKYDEAIVVFQQAQNHPKHRVESLHFLGRSFLIQHMTPEAVETLKRSIDEYDLAATGDKKSKDLHYWYARALEENKQVAEAIDIYSKVVQWDIGYLDARKRMTELRTQQPAQPPQ
jgi:tetratricopeptide (TPR) repeat protein